MTLLPGKRIGDGVLNGGDSLFVYVDSLGCHGVDGVETICGRLWHGVVTIEHQHMYIFQLK